MDYFTHGRLPPRLMNVPYRTLHAAGAPTRGPATHHSTRPPFHNPSCRSVCRSCFKSSLVGRKRAISRRNNSSSNCVRPRPAHRVAAGATTPPDGLVPVRQGRTYRGPLKSTFPNERSTALEISPALTRRSPQPPGRIVLQVDVRDLQPVDRVILLFV